jgi:RimJ/RimL family protein N-acetyltransferase
MIRLEYFEEKDFEQLMNWINSEELMINWAGSLFSFPLSQRAMAWYIRNTNDLDKADALVYKVIDEQTGEAVGHISLGGISRKNKSARISRVLVGSTAHKGKGLCKHMIRAVCKIGFEELGLHRISLGVYSFNESAIKCYQSSGFSIEGVSRDSLLHNGEFWSLVEMSILENEWRDQSAL